MSNSKIYLGSTNLGTGKIRLGANDVSAIYLGTSLLYPPTTPPTPTGDYLCFTANAANCTVGMTNNGSNQPVMYYSTDQTNWTLWDYSNITLTNVGDKVYFYGDNPNGFSSSNSNYSKFTTSGSVACSGNIMTLITRDGSGTTTPSAYCFCYLFTGTTITTAPELPATTISRYCYDSMFMGCTSLITPPTELPATRLAPNCYYYMFYGCTSLTTAPELPATTLDSSCYNNMFNGCSQLNYIKVGATTWNSSYTTNWVNGVAATGTFVKPAELVIGNGTGQIPSNSPNGIPTGWTVVDGNMLHFTAQQANSTIGYTSTLATPPTIYKSTDGVNFTSWDGTAVTLSNIGDVLYVYGSNQTLAESTNVQPFRNYTKFVMTGGIAAEGDATYLLQNGGLSTITNNYALYGLFENCTSLTQAPSLPATTLSRECYGHMFDGCTGLTKAPQLPATTLAYNCYVSMFKGCTSLTQAPTLSATTLAQGCYSSMFKGCTSLIQAPALPATTLAINSYYGMFQNCSNLNSVTCLATDISATDCTYNWLENVAATGTFTKSPNMSSWTTGASGIPSGWTVVDAQ